MKDQKINQRIKGQAYYLKLTLNEKISFRIKPKLSNLSSPLTAKIITPRMAMLGVNIIKV